MLPWILAALLASTAPLALAHDYGRDDRGGSWRNSARSRAYSSDPVLIALRDLNSIASRARVDRHEANHFRRAIDELRDFQERAQRGRFDSSSLRDAIGNMEHLADARQLHPRDRAIIQRDLRALHALRSGGGWR